MKIFDLDSYYFRDNILYTACIHEENDEKIRIYVGPENGLADLADSIYKKYPSSFPDKALLIEELLAVHRLNKHNKRNDFGYPYPDDCDPWA